MQKITKKLEKDSWKYIPLNDPSLVWTTYDMNCSVALMCSGFKLINIDRKADSNKALFIFKKGVGLEDVVGLYWSDLLDVKVRTFADTIKALKNRLYSE
jgi:hypothetical protein